MKNPKEKGNNFERKVAKLFSLWSGHKFMRTPASGAIHNFKDKRVVSDIVAPLSIGEWPFSIECKNVMCSWELNTLLEGTSETMKSHWKQAQDDADREGLAPLLIFTKNFRDKFIVLRPDDYIKAFAEYANKIDRIELFYEGEKVIICHLDELFLHRTVEQVIRAFINPVIRRPIQT